jgi:predicted double-glycine peptidase
MNANWTGISCALLALAAFILVYWWGSRQCGRCRVVLTVVALLAAVPGASFALYYAKVIPEAPWYYEMRSIVGIELLIVWVGVAGGMVATLLPRTLLGLPLFVAGAFAVVPFIKPFIGPVGKLEDQWKDGVCLQSTPSTCGAASTATVLSDLGGNTGEEELAMAAHSYDRGTEAWYLARAARVRGYQVRFDFADGFNPDCGLPAVVGVLTGARGHFIAVLGREGDKFVIGDPLVGREVLSLKEMKERWEFTGFHMRVWSPERKRDPKEKQSAEKPEP